MDYHYEQTSEVEALDSIYYGDMQILQTEPMHKFSIPIKSEEYDEGEGLACELVFTYTPKYPEELPSLEINTEESFDEIVDKNELYKHLMEQANENLGMVMIFTLVSAGQEWLNEKWDSIKKDREEAVLLKKKAEEEAEMKRFEGTRVTVESFLAWRKQFEIEMGIPAKREKENKDKNKLTGKELFMRDTTLNESDLKFLDDGDAVKVDESLFQDLDDLDISDEDDEDYVPGQSETDSD
ncbi:RWD domain-containing protein 1 [Danaus plexippus plexippus]|uniref:RWD domain-containing protein 1 n=1 Tax=Danaus plexippus plexippus TaxID=278856 RepID=A0A212EN86_DANPL|nr:RWD domain-containing protein 1 [Danaus plexippus plexippus]